MEGVSVGGSVTRSFSLDRDNAAMGEGSSVSEAAKEKVDLYEEFVRNGGNGKGTAGITGHGASSVIKAAELSDDVLNVDLRVAFTESRRSSAFEYGIVRHEVNVVGGSMLPYSEQGVGELAPDEDADDMHDWIQSLNDAPGVIRTHVIPLTSVFQHPDMVRRYRVAAVEEAREEVNSLVFKGKGPKAPTQDNATNATNSSSGSSSGSSGSSGSSHGSGGSGGRSGSSSSGSGGGSSGATGRKGIGFHGGRWGEAGEAGGT